MLGRVGNDVANDAHRRLGRVDVGVADHELLEDVVLDGPGQLVLRNALFFGCNDVAGQNRQHSAVHGHGHRYLVQRNAAEQDLHVFHRIDGHTRLAHIARHARMVAVIPPMRGQIEGHADPLAARSQRLAVEGIGFLGSRKTRVLADRPRPACIHGGLRATDERLKTRQGVGVRQVLDVFCRIQRLDSNAVRRQPVECAQVAILDGFGGGFAPVFETAGGKQGSGQRFG